MSDQNCEAVSQDLEEHAFRYCRRSSVYEQRSLDMDFERSSMLKIGLSVLLPVKFHLHARTRMFASRRIDGSESCVRHTSSTSCAKVSQVSESTGQPTAADYTGCWSPAATKAFGTVIMHAQTACWTTEIASGAIIDRW